MGALGLRGRISRSSLVVYVAVAVTVAARLPLLDLPAWPDEAGLLTIGGGWGLGGSAGQGSLYGSYWVDRPPLLITLYGAAERLGGLLALRLLGAAAAALTVAAVADVARQVAGRRGAAWAALTMAAFVSTPFHWSFMVDAELLAVPMTAMGLALVTRGSLAVGRRGLLLSGCGGIAGGAAVLTKQNLVDVFVFAAALGVLHLLRRSMAPGVVARHAAAFLGGALLTGAVVGAWTVAHGTSLGEVFDAMYSFRVSAAETVLARSDASSWSRLRALGFAAALSGLLLLGLLVVGASVRRRHRQVHVLALLAVLAYGLVSVFLGMNYWLHYLLQPAVPVAILTGIVATQSSIARLGSLLVSGLALAGWAVLVWSPPQTAEELVGEAVAGAASPGDSIVTIPGHSNVTYAAGLPSPYEHLWALPARVLDPGGLELQELLNGSRAPTWLVLWRHPVTAHPDSVGFAIADNYQVSARICGRWVYVHDGVERPRPVPRPRRGASHTSACEPVTALPHVLRELVSRRAP